MRQPAGEAKERAPLSGLVERVTFHNAESGFCVLRVKMRGQRDLVTVLGSAAEIHAGEHIQASGHWEQHREHGPQFRALFLQVTPPSSREGIERYLASGLIKGIGPHFAKRLVAAFGEAVFDVIEKTPCRLLEVGGIGEVRLARITAGWADQKAIREIMVFLQSHGMGTWLVRVHFPNGVVRYARYSTVVEALVSDLYEDVRDKGEIDDSGNICYRAEVAGEPSPVDPRQPLSEPEEIILVRIEVEPDHMTWPALYCRRRKQIVGPHSKFVAAAVQHRFELIRRDDRLHLVSADGATQTLCGEPADGKVMPFLRYDYPGKLEDTSEPAPRDLYAEWSDGHVCRRCLLQDQALRAGG
jgi:hypothetical protein